MRLGDLSPGARFTVPDVDGVVFIYRGIGTGQSAVGFCDVEGSATASAVFDLSAPVVPQEGEEEGAGRLRPL